MPKFTTILYRTEKRIKRLECEAANKDEANHIFSNSIKNRDVLLYDMDIIYEDTFIDDIQETK